MGDEDKNGEKPATPEKKSLLRFLAGFAGRTSEGPQINHDGELHPDEELPNSFKEELTVHTYFSFVTFGRATKRLVNRYMFISDEVKSLMNIFRSSDALSAEEKTELDKVVFEATFASVLAGQEFYLFRVTLIKLILFLSGLAGATWVVITIYHQYLNPEHIPLGLRVGFDALYVLVTFLCLLLYFAAPYCLFRVLPGPLLPVAKSDKLIGWFSQIHIWFFVVLSVTVVILTYPQGPQYYLMGHIHSVRQLVKAALVSGLESAIVLWLLALICLLCFGISYVVESWSSKQRTPHIVIVNGLRDLLYEAEERKDLWNDFSYKREVMFKIENIAVCVERYLPLHLESSDPSSDYKIRQSTSEMAAFLRSWKLWVATPMPYTRQNFVACVGRNLVSAAQGNWATFGKLPPDKITITKAWYARLLSLVRATVVASLPALVLWLVRRPPLHLVMPTYANVAVLIWAVITILIEIDPGFSAKAEALKSIKEAFSGGKEK